MLMTMCKGYYNSHDYVRVMTYYSHSYCCSIDQSETVENTL